MASRYTRRVRREMACAPLSEAPSHFHASPPDERRECDGYVAALMELIGRPKRGSEIRRKDR